MTEMGTNVIVRPHRRGRGLFLCRPVRRRRDRPCRRGHPCRRGRGRLCRGRGPLCRGRAGSCPAPARLCPGAYTRPLLGST